MSKLTNDQPNLVSEIQPESPQDTLKSKFNLNSKPYFLLEAWRGLASLLVVMFHACDSADASLHLGTLPFYALCMKGYLGVQIFFVLSGYCIANAAVSCLRKRTPVSAYMAARIRRIYPPYLAAVIVTVIVAALAAHLVKSGSLGHSSLGKENPFSHSVIWYISTITLSQQIFGQTNIVPPAWTLNFEVAFYIIVGFFLAGAIRFESERILLNSLHTLTISALLWIIIAPTRTIYPFNLWPEFGIGVATYDLLANPRLPQSKAAFIIITILSVAVAVAHNVQGYSAYGGTRIEYSTVAIFAMLLVALYKLDAQLSKHKIIALLASVGTFSYSLYLTHELVRGVVMQISRKMHITTDTYFIVVIAQIVLALLVARVFFIFFERPFMSKRKKVILNI